MIKIHRERNIDGAIVVLSEIPEFDEIIDPEKLMSRLQDDAIILVAYFEEKAVGCKIAYDRYHDKSLYSWLGAVLPKYRNKGIAHKLNTEMERLAAEKGFTSMVFKTRNKFKAMLQFGLKNGYQIIGFEEKDVPSENRILLKKEL